MVHAPAREHEADDRLGNRRRLMGAGCVGPPEASLPRDHSWGSRDVGLVAMATEGDHGGATPRIGSDRI